MAGASNVRTNAGVSASGISGGQSVLAATVANIVRIPLTGRAKNLATPVAASTASLAVANVQNAEAAPTSATFKEVEVPLTSIVTGVTLTGWLFRDAAGARPFAGPVSATVYNAAGTGGAVLKFDDEYLFTGDTGEVLGTVWLGLFLDAGSANAEAPLANWQR
tara:strand:- start:550 stop:1038 length:489 start_codon:yes stop_codon:yes gene_type:complete